MYEFCNRDSDKCTFSFQKGVYPYEYMDSWKRFDEPVLRNKKENYR